MLFISNVSRTAGGVPACICYYNAGINNNYKMRYKQPTEQSIRKRLILLEKSVIGKIADSGSFSARIEILERKLLGKKKSGAISNRLGRLEKSESSINTFKNMNFTSITV